MDALFSRDQDRWEGMAQHRRFHFLFETLPGCGYKDETKRIGGAGLPNVVSQMSLRACTFRNTVRDSVYIENL